MIKTYGQTKERKQSGKSIGLSISIDGPHLAYGLGEELSTSGEVNYVIVIIERSILSSDLDGLIGVRFRLLDMFGDVILVKHQWIPVDEPSTVRTD